MAEKKKVVSDKKKEAVKKKETAGCSGKCWCCGGHNDFDEEE